MAITKKILVETVQGLLEAFEARFEVSFEKIDQRFEKIDQRFEKIDQRFERIETLLVSHDHTLKTLVTREEFNVFKVENFEAHADLAISLEKVDQEFTVFTAAHDRLEDRVNTHEEVLVRNRLMKAVR